jgi:hypothetical protein
VCHRPSVSLNKENVSRQISENKIAVCEKTQGLRSGNFSDLNSACSTVLVPLKIFQFQDMHYENRFLGTFQGHSKRPRRREAPCEGTNPPPPRLFTPGETKALGKSKVHVWVIAKNSESIYM